MPPRLQPGTGRQAIRAGTVLLAVASLSACHSNDPKTAAPGIATLLTHGKGRTPRDLGLMKLVGKKHFACLTPRERSAIIAYVKARAAR